MKLIIIIIFVWTSAQICSAQEFFPWPVTPFDESHVITGAFAEYRSTSAEGHFHNGTDIPKPDGSPVYPVKNGTVSSIGSVASYGSNAWVRINDIAYVHITPNPSLSVGDPVIASQTILGTIISGMGHVHFTDGYVGSERNSTLMTRGFDPYVDTWSPIIRYIQFYQNNTQNRFSDNRVTGLVDIIVKVDEQNGPPGSSTSVLNNGTYKIGYKIMSADTGTVVFEPPNGGVRFQFDTKPNNSYVNIVYYRPFSSTTSHVYQVTNDVDGDNYWDTRFLPDSVYVVMVFTEDTRQNTDTAYATVEIEEADITPPLIPVFRNVRETETGMHLVWFPNPTPDLDVYKLYFSFDNQVWTQFGEDFNKQVTETTIQQVLGQDVYFRLTALDNAPVPNESDSSDTYGLSNGEDFLGKVLIVDGFDRTSGSWPKSSHFFGYTHGTAVIANQFSFDTVPNESVEDSLVDLNDYQAVIWILGDESSVDETFSTREQELVKVYLENGGNLFVSGSEIASDLDPDAYSEATPDDETFLHEYLKADYVSSDPASQTAAGGAGSIFAGMNLNYGMSPYPVGNADVIVPFGNQTVAALRYDQDKIAAVQYAGVFGESTVSGKVVYSAIPFETIDGRENRTELMERVLQFFFGTMNIDPDKPPSGVVPDKFTLLNNYPNPFNPETRIEYLVPARSEVRIEVFNAVGQKIRTLVNGSVPAGRHEAVWNGRDEQNRLVSSGIYIVRFSGEAAHVSDSYRESRKIILTK